MPAGLATCICHSGYLHPLFPMPTWNLVGLACGFVALTGVLTVWIMAPVKGNKKKGSLEGGEKGREISMLTW